MLRTVALALAVALGGAALSMTSSAPAVAQVFKPVMSLIVNDDSQAVPVRVVPAPATVVHCRTGASGTIALGSPLQSSTLGARLSSTTCPDDVRALDVRRVWYAPDEGATSPTNVVHYRALLGFARSDQPQLRPTDVFAISTDGSPVMDLAAPVRLQFDGDEQALLMWSLVASSGLDARPVILTGVWHLEGTPVAP